MKEIYIAGHQVSSAQSTLSLHPGTDAIIITDPGWALPPFVVSLAKSHLHLQFNDTLNPDPKANPPREEHLKAALDWSLGKERVMVACHQGISRSSALALLIAAREWGVEDCFKILTPGMHHPNRLMLRLGSKMTGLPIYDRYGAWRRENGHEH